MQNKPIGTSRGQILEVRRARTKIRNSYATSVRSSRAGGIRPTLLATASFGIMSVDVLNGAVRKLLVHIQSLSPGQISVFGTALGTVTTAAKHQAAPAPHHLVQPHLHTNAMKVVTYRLGCGVSIHLEIHTPPRSYDTLWDSGNQQDIQSYGPDSSKMSAKDLTVNWKLTFSVRSCLQMVYHGPLDQAIAEAAQSTVTNGAPSADNSDRLLNILEEVSAGLISDPSKR
jgi:hypothetical protein